MQNQPSSREKNLESSIGLSLLAGTPIFCALLLALSATGWAISGWSPEFSPSLMIHQWWLESVKLLRMTLALTFAIAIFAGSLLLTVALGNCFRRMWWRLHHR